MSLPNGDFDRCNNQKKVVLSLIKKVSLLSRLEKIKLGLKLLPLLQTNIGLNVIFDLLKLDFENYSINTYTLRGANYYNKGYYYKLDNDYLRRIKEIIN